jgi:hypothetical protein
MIGKIVIKTAWTATILGATATDPFQQTLLLGISHEIIYHQAAVTVCQSRLRSPLSRAKIGINE